MLGMRIVLCAGTIALFPVAASAQDRPITNREPGVLDAARTPMTDLNLSRTEIPALLAEAQQRPYSLQGLSSCDQLKRAVGELDGVLGPDMDLPQAERARLSGGRIAQWAVGRFIPFRGLIREISGANKQQREVEEAIQSGLVRRAFLKGVGAAKRCPYPASPATETIVNQHLAAIAKEDAAAEPNTASARIEPDPMVGTTAAAEPTKPAAKAPVIYTAQPVVQQTR